ncbi:PREDICTED: prorelaxin-like [Chinchilla lanigera]|uniref:prorelaxin-like n=1 Tax=Chinchilla lanigera TaxID=34839 RepID=UPI00038EA988|nr:PREDICTED: prorelaxin-like [Chinchilla lanigera]
MLHLVSFHLLGIWLLLSHTSGVVPPGWLDEVTKLCGRELVRARIEICGKVLWEPRALGQKQERILGSGPSTEITPSSINKDGGSLTTSEFTPNLLQELKATSLPQLQQYVPALKNSSVGAQDLKKIINETQDEAEDNGHSVLKYLESNIRSLKKRETSKKCCRVGCTRRSIAKSC